MTKLKLSAISLFLLTIFICHMPYAICKTYAQDSNTLASLSKRIIEAKKNEDLYAPFEELKELYFKEDEYSGLVEFLKSLSQQKETLGPFINYYTALARYNQIKYLEKAQEWDEYFNQGNNYRDEITASLQKVMDSTGAKDALNIYSRLLLWQFHKDQQDAFIGPALTDLMNAISEYAKDSQDIKPIKEAADKLLECGEKGKSKELYAAYVNKLIGSVKEDKELGNIAAGFYKEGNLELSESVYDAYIERIIKTYPKEKLMPVLIEIAGNFAYKDEGRKDASYAERIFQKIEEAGSKNAFNEELTYLRAYNAEKIKDYLKAKDLYLDLLGRYPQAKYADEAEFKAAIISTYILRDMKTGRVYFEKLSSKEILSPQVISSLYQLGLLSQWENNFPAATDYYNKLIQKAGSDYSDMAALAQVRLKEITGLKQIEYNLKVFLDASLKEENPVFAVTSSGLNSSRYVIKKDEGTDINCTPYTVESGCMHVEIQYLWSGDLGTTKPGPEKSGFRTMYTQRGTKVINVVVVSTGGVLDRSIDMVDVY